MNMNTMMGANLQIEKLPHATSLSPIKKVRTKVINYPGPLRRQPTLPSGSTVH